MRASETANIVGDNEAKSRLSEILEKVEGGEEFTITKHGAPVAKLIPVKKRTSADVRTAAIRRIEKLGASLSLGVKIKDLIEQGRK